MPPIQDPPCTHTTAGSGPAAPAGSPDRARLASEAAALQAWHTVHTPAVILLDAQLGALLLEATQPGTPLGYLHWSLLDNYEWGSHQRTFGLVAVDHATFARTIEPSARWLGRVARANGPARDLCNSMWESWHTWI